MKRIIGILSGKGGSGKSTCAVGIGAALCELGKQVLLVDLDAGLRCLDVMLDTEDELVFDLGDVLDGTDPESAILPCRQFAGLSLLAAPAAPRDIDGNRLCDFLLSQHRFDYIILDFPAGLKFPFISEIAELTDFCVVCTADRVGVRDSENMSGVLKKSGGECRIIINKYRHSLVRRGLYCGVDDVIDCSGCRLLGIVPFDDRMSLYGVLHRKSLTRNAFLRIAKRIYGYDISLPRITNIEKGR